MFAPAASNAVQPLGLVPEGRSPPIASDRSRVCVCVRVTACARICFTLNINSEEFIGNSRISIFGAANERRF